MSRFKEKRPLGAFDSLSISNRNKQTFESLDKESSETFDTFINKTASSVQTDVFEKEASFANGLRLFSDVKQTIKNKLGVSDTIADELSSKVIVKSEQIMKEYGGDQVEIVGGIVDEIKGQAGESLATLDNSFALHPLTHNSKHIEEQVKKRLIEEGGLSYGDAEMFQKVIYKVAQDLTTMIRPYKREELALAVTELFLETKDRTIVYNIKTTPALINSLRDILLEQGV